MNLSNLLFKSLQSKYTAEMDDAKARLFVYANNPVGIGEHPQLTEEMDKLVEQYVNAQDKLNAAKLLQKDFSTQKKKEDVSTKSQKAKS